MHLARRFPPLVAAALFASIFCASSSAQLLPGSSVTVGALLPVTRELADPKPVPSIRSGWTAAAPVVDGALTGSEWAAASTYEIGTGARPVTLYVMNDAGHLYIAIDDQADRTDDPGDFLALVFDDEGGPFPVIGNGMFDATSSPSGEGLLAVGRLQSLGAPADIIYCGFTVGTTCSPEAATGTAGAWSHLTGHAVYEMRVDFAGSQLHAGPGETFRVFIGSISEGQAYTGLTSLDPYDPATFAPLELAIPPIGPAATNVCYGSRVEGGYQFVTIDPATGAATTIGSTGLSLPGLAVSPAGVVLGTSAGTAAVLYRIDPATGTPYPVGSTGLDSLDAIAFDRDGTLWGVGDPDTSMLYTIDPSTGAATPIGATGVHLVGLAFDPNDGTLYASGGPDASGVLDAIYTVDTSSGEATVVGATGLGAAQIPDLCFDVHGHLFGLASGGGLPGDLAAIDKATGAGTLVGATGLSGIGGLATQAFLGRADPHACYGSTGGWTGLLMKVDLATGAGTLIGDTGIPGVPGLAISPRGDVFGTSSYEGSLAPADLYRIDAETGAAYLVGNTGVQFMDAIAFDADGVLWGLGDPGPDRLFKINTSTAQVKWIGFTGLLNGWGLSGMAFDPGSGTLYASRANAGNEIYAVDTTTAHATLVGTTGITGTIMDLAFGAQGDRFGQIPFYAASSNGSVTSLIEIDRFTGVGTVIGPIGIEPVGGLATGPWSALPSLAMLRAQAAAAAQRGALAVGATLAPARPNPFGASTELRFTARRAGPVVIDVFDVLGKRVTRLVDGDLEAGEHFVRWSGLDSGGRPVGDGVYYVRMRAGGATETRSVVRIR